MDLNENRFCLLRLNIFAKAREVVNFANSEGCILKLPILNHELAPPVSFAKNKTAISDIIVIPYKTKESVSKNLQSIIRITNAANREIPIHKSFTASSMVKKFTSIYTNT